jgi:hypothetical protein
VDFTKSFFVLRFTINADFTLRIRLPKLVEMDTTATLPEDPHVGIESFVRRYWTIIRCNLQHTVQHPSLSVE